MANPPSNSKPNYLAVASGHLERVKAAVTARPADWRNLALYGFYCVEVCIQAAAEAAQIATTRKHWEKADVATQLHKQHNLTDVAGLQRLLNRARKAFGYGDIDFDEGAHDPRKIAKRLESYFNEVKVFVESHRKT